MPLSEKNADTLGCLLWWPGMILCGMGGALLLMSGLVPEALLDAVPLLGLLIIVGGIALGAALAGFIPQLFTAQHTPPPREVDLPDTQHLRPPTPEEWGHRDHDYLD